MGMFDSVYFNCPGDSTHPQLEVQTKVRRWPSLEVFAQEHVPVEIAYDIENEEVYCDRCCKPYKVVHVNPQPPRTLQMTLVSM